MLLERTGETLQQTDLPARLLTEPPSILVAHNFSYLLLELDAALDSNPAWQYRISPVKRYSYRWDRPAEQCRVAVLDLNVSFCGFRAPPKSKRRGHYHYPLDPVLFVRGSIDNLIDGDEPRLHKLLLWAQSVREWCNRHGLRITVNLGGIGGQLLRDPRFYPNARRKVPKRVNAQARPTLPGNYYQLCAPTGKTYPHALYLDMRSAHHYCASVIDFPSADHLVLHGRRITQQTLDDGIYRQAWSDRGRGRERLLSSHGLLLVQMTVPYIPKYRFPPPYMTKPGRRLAWVYTNELPMIRSLGGIVEGIEAAYTSHIADSGLNKYAQWAMAETETLTAESKRWVKPALLSTYGMLAARPRIQTFGYKRADGGTPRTYPAGSGLITARVKETLHEIEPTTANVIHRGMIEAECRIRLLTLARELHTHKITILSVYADSIIIDATTGTLPLLPEPWIVKHELTRLRFFNPTSFTSREMTKLPGIPREGLDSIRRLQRIRALTANP